MIRAAVVDDMKKTIDERQILYLLERCRLPIEDIRKNKNITFFTEYKSSKLCGVVAIEQLGSAVLLRSLAVAEGSRGTGIGSRLTKLAIEQVRRRGIVDVYLLTEHAQEYFLKHGFLELDRILAPDEIKQSNQFKHLCPDNSTLMVKSLR